MKANKPLKEAILRAPESTDESKQAQQEQLYHMGESSTTEGQADKPQDLVDERARNCMESLHNLRELEYDVEKIQKGKS